jgi:hypothetical protein
MAETAEPHHLLLIGAGPGVGAGVVRRFGREGFRSTLSSRRNAVDQLAPELRAGGLEIDAIAADIEDLDGYRETLERIFDAPGPPRCRCVQRCPAGSRRDTRHHHRAAPNGPRRRCPRRRRRGPGSRTRPAGSWRRHPFGHQQRFRRRSCARNGEPLDGKAALRSAQTLIAAGVREDGIHAATVTIAGAVKPGTDFDPDNIAELFWSAHTDSQNAWLTEYRFTGPQPGAGALQ